MKSLWLLASIVLVLPLPHSKAMDFTPEQAPVMASFDFTCTPTIEAEEVVEAVEPYNISYRNLWYVNGSLDPAYQRSHLKNGHGLDPVAVDALTNQEVLAAHAADHEGTLDHARFNEYFAARGNPNNKTQNISYVATQTADCPDGQCPIEFAPAASRTVTRTRTVQQSSCPSGSCPTYSTRTVYRSGPARPVARTVTAPVRYFRTNQPVRTFFRNGGFFRRCR